MKINNIKVKNFRSYKGITEFDFRFQEDKNIILIGGENGAGKSSIFEAIKLCLYGPLTYKYQGMGTNYISKIKAMINEDAYSDENIESFLEVEIKMNNRGEEQNYTIRRQWSLDKSKLVEEFIVLENETILNEVETENFYEYFKSLIPPAVFDLSFFDGEKLFEFFEDRISGSKLKETMLTLNNFDIFNILSKELELNTRRKNREKKNLKSEIIELEAIEKNLNDKTNKLNDVNKGIEDSIEDIENLNMQIIAKNNDFISAGGLNQEERDKLIHDISKLESERDKINSDIKIFSNEILPFLMIKEDLRDVEKQIYYEQEFIVHETIKDRLDTDSIVNLLMKKNLEFTDMNLVVEEITKIIISNDFDDDFEPLYHLSKEQSNKVVSKINEISNTDVSTINYFDDIKIITDRIASNRKKLRNSMDMVEEKKYIEDLDNMNKDLNSKSIVFERLKSVKEKLDKEIEMESKNLVKVNERIDLIKKADNIKDISDSIIDMTDDLLTKITSSKREEISSYFNEIFSNIIRKDKFIDYIDIDINFDVNLYVRKNLKSSELIYMVNNLGIVEMKDKLGYRFVEELGLDDKVNKNQLLKYLNEIDNNKVLELSTKIDIMNLSSGEKQIYILCLYWALIKSANISIPFIIDTPYARIDEKHRDSITTKFLPNISEQVIVLSTNTEIDEKLYKEIKEFVSKEYTLDYDNDSRSTKVNSGYFYEVR